MGECLTFRLACRTHLFQTREDLRNAGSREPVKNLLPATFVNDEPCVSQHREMIGNRGSIATDHLSEIGHATLAVGQHVHDEDAAGVSQSFEDIGCCAVFLRCATDKASGLRG